MLLEILRSANLRICSVLIKFDFVKGKNKKAALETEQPFPFIKID